MEKSLLLAKSYGRSVLWLCAAFLAFCSTLLHAQPALLSAEEAFPVQVESVSAQEVQLHWDIPEHYYLYQHKFEVRQGQHVLPLTLPKAQALFDDNYGQTQVYYQQVQFNVPAQASQTYQVTWQGCAKDRICYPPQTIEFKTDADGLVALQNQSTAPKRLLDLNSNLNHATVENAEVLDQSTTPTASPTAQDQRWSAQLAQRSPIYGLLLFLGLGILLAFTPCSLPMIPILSSLIVRDRRGVKAWMIALVFVCSMAMVYAVLGLVASSAGLNFQRWLQQPSTLIAFSLLFVVFSFNLFGMFELRLPHAVVHRLDHWQSMQKGGSLLGAAVMGMISALLVGPCMTAPLAGALLFISQTQNQWQGALLLFTLGFGMGLPLLLASILGAKALPKAGLWMNQIKVLFAFLMLALALYFIRPLLSEGWMQGLSLLLGLSFICYVLYRALWQKSPLRPLYLVILIVAVPYVIYSQYQQSQRFFVEQSSQQAQWQVAQTAAEFQQILAQAPKDRGIVIDVYADWCVACQPIEHRILKSAQVQQSLSPYTLIKLDLSHYDASHQQLLNQWDILGPPTYLFLSPAQQEIRGLRLTGAFSETELLQQLQQFQQGLGH